MILYVKGDNLIMKRIENVAPIFVNGIYYHADQVKTSLGKIFGKFSVKSSGRVEHLSEDRMEYVFNDKTYCGEQIVRDATDAVVSSKNGTKIKDVTLSFSSKNGGCENVAQWAKEVYQNLSNNGLECDVIVKWNGLASNKFSSYVPNLSIGANSGDYTKEELKEFSESDAIHAMAKDILSKAVSSPKAAINL